ncbi:hypothetical protein PLESTF_000102000 [Pleodorina starrii]|nr:hypothetical protein PLESTF_000102000 [Pleodorina starrii]
MGMCGSTVQPQLPPPGGYGALHQPGSSGRPQEQMPPTAQQQQQQSKPQAHAAAVVQQPFSTQQPFGGEAHAGFRPIGSSSGGGMAGMGMGGERRSCSSLAVTGPGTRRAALGRRRVRRCLHRSSSSRLTPAPSHSSRSVAEGLGPPAWGGTLGSMVGGSGGRMAGMGMGGGTAQLQQPGGYGAWHSASGTGTPQGQTLSTPEPARKLDRNARVSAIAFRAAADSASFSLSRIRSDGRVMVACRSRSFPRLPAFPARRVPSASRRRLRYRRRSPPAAGPGSLSGRRRSCRRCVSPRCAWSISCPSAPTLLGARLQALGANFGPFAPPSSVPLAGLSPGVLGSVSAPGPLLPGFLPAVPQIRSIGTPAFLPSPGCSAGLPQLGSAGKGAPPLGVASSRLARISGRLRASPPAPSAEQDMVYQRRLAAVNQVLQGALSGKTVDRQDASTAEFLDWLTYCGCGRSWADCTPDDVLVHMVTWWLPHRHGRDGGEVGPSAVKACLSALSGVFAWAGRNGPYNAYIAQGRMAGMGMGGERRSCSSLAATGPGTRRAALGRCRVRRCLHCSSSSLAARAPCYVKSRTSLHSRSSVPREDVRHRQQEQAAAGKQGPKDRRVQRPATSVTIAAGRLSTTGGVSTSASRSVLHAARTRGIGLRLTRRATARCAGQGCRCTQEARGKAPKGCQMMCRLVRWTDVNQKTR